MTVLTRTYSNGHVRTMTVISVVAGDEAGVALVTTAEEGVIAVTQDDMADVYAQILSLGLL